VLFSLQKTYNTASSLLLFPQKIYNTASCCSLYRKYTTMPVTVVISTENMQHCLMNAVISTEKYTTLPHAVLSTENIQQCP
jgi:hypothetical protein